MLRVKTKVDKSSIKGLGLFADQFIPKGTVTWQYDEILDTAIDVEMINSLDPVSKDFVETYSYFDKDLGKYVLCCDNQRYINHSQNAEKRNILSTPKKDVAARDINQGEELLCDYNLFDPEYFKRININESDLI